MFGHKAPRISVWVFAFIVAALWILGSPRTANAQDPFEIRTEEYERPAWGEFSFEEHINYVQHGSVDSDGSVAPTNHQLRASSELTAGIRDHLSLGLMLMTARRPGVGMEYAGWRVMPHFYAPDSWHLPVKLGLTTEFSFQRIAFDESASTIELRPIVERRFGRAQFDVNPAFERPLSSSPASNAWVFQPSFRFAYEASRRIAPSIEYYGAVGPLTNLLPARSQVHQIYPGVSVRLAGAVQWDLGVGVGLTPKGNQLVYKTRVEFSFGRHSQ